MFAYCLFCNAARCTAIADHIERDYGCRAIQPKIVQQKWVRGKLSRETHDLLPGYIFLFAKEPIESFSAFRDIDSVYRILGEVANGYRLANEDLAFAMALYGSGGTIDRFKAFREGDRVHLVKGAAGGMEGEILRLDRRGRALVRCRFDDKSLDLWVGLEMVEKDKTNQSL